MKKQLLFAALSVGILCFSFSSCKKANNDGGVEENPYPGEILAAPFENSVPVSDLSKPGELLVMDYSGKVTKSKKLSTAGLDFKRWIINGKIRYSYMEFDPTSHLAKFRGAATGSAVILDENLNEINRFWLLPHNGRTEASEKALDGHDFILLDDFHYIGVTYYEVNPKNIPGALNPDPNVRVLTPIIQEVLNGKVIWEWIGSDYPEFYTTSVESNNFSTSAITHDYMHINSIFIDPRDKHIICSFRNMDQVVKLHRQTGKVLWRLGGKNSDFPMSNEQKFLRQHTATYVDNNETLLIFDNGEANIRPFSRIVEYKLDETAKKIKSFKSYTLPGNTFCAYMASVQKTDSTYFIGGGTVPKYWEINHKTGKINYERNLPSNSYRVFKY